MFVDTAVLPVARLLERHAATFDRFLDRIDPGEFMPWVVERAYAGGWSVFGVFHHERDWTFGGQFQDHGAEERATATIAVLRRIPGLLSAGFTRLEPGTHIYPHVDNTVPSVRCLVGLRVNPGARMRAGDETRVFERHRCLAFRSLVTHEAVNEGTTARIAFGVEVRLDHAWDPIEATDEERGLDQPAPAARNASASGGTIIGRSSPA